MPRDAAPEVMPELGLDTLFGVKGKVSQARAHELHAAPAANGICWLTCLLTRDRSLSSLVAALVSER